MRAVVVPIIALLSISACDNSPTAPSVDEQLEQVRAATEGYANIESARAAGYTVWSPDPTPTTATCASDPSGRMGYHLVNTSLRGSPADPVNGDAVLDPLKPEMLLWEKRPDGTMHLVGVEYLVFRAAWERVHGADAAPPQLFGQPVPLSTHAFTPGGAEVPHYEVHVWLYEANPLGMFAPWNPNVTC